MNSFKLFIIRYQFLFLLPVAVNFLLPEPAPVITGSWFTDFQQQPNGWMIKELTVRRPNSFILSRLDYNRTKGWEETRITGRVEFTGNKMILVPSFCRNFAIPSFNKRMALIRAYECDHLQFVFYPEKEKLLPAFELAGEEQFIQYRGDRDGQTAVIMIGDGLAWGNRLQYLKVPDKSYHQAVEEITVTSQTDSTISTGLQLPKGTVIYVGK